MSETEKKQTVKKVAAKETPQKQGSVVYIGPDIPGAKQYTTYNNGLPDAIKEKIKAHPFFDSFVVPVSKLARASAELTREGSALNTLFRKAEKINRQKEEG